MEPPPDGDPAVLGEARSRRRAGVGPQLLPPRACPRTTIPRCTSCSTSSRSKTSGLPGAHRRRDGRPHPRVERDASSDHARPARVRYAGHRALRVERPNWRRAAVELPRHGRGGRRRGRHLLLERCRATSPRRRARDGGHVPAEPLHQRGALEHPHADARLPDEAHRAEPGPDRAGGRRHVPDRDRRAQDPGLPNWLDTGGHRRGTIFWRFLLPDEQPETPRCRVS